MTIPGTGYTKRTSRVYYPEGKYFASSILLFRFPVSVSSVNCPYFYLHFLNNIPDSSDHGLKFFFFKIQDDKVVAYVIFKYLNLFFIHFFKKKFCCFVCIRMILPANLVQPAR